MPAFTPLTSVPAFTPLTSVPSLQVQLQPDVTLADLPRWQLAPLPSDGGSSAVPTAVPPVVPVELLQIAVTPVSGPLRLLEADAEVCVWVVVVVVNHSRIGMCVLLLLCVPCRVTVRCEVPSR